MNLEDYLEAVQNQEESIFPMDSLHKKKKPFRPVYPESVSIGHEDKRVMIDFDKTIHSYHKGFSDGEIYGYPLEGSKEAIEYLKESGFEIVIFTARLSIGTEFEKLKRKENVAEWLDRYEIPYDDITANKLPAICYIDDKAITFRGCWEEVIQNFEQIKKTEI